MTTPSKEASGSVNRSSCPDSVRYMSVTTVVQPYVPPDLPVPHALLNFRETIFTSLD
jgi:hypothetical protein